MSIYIILSAIFILRQCSTVAAVPLLENSLSNKTSDIQIKSKIDLLAILNSGNDADENDFEDSNELTDDNDPKITIWEFPTERRAFIGDFEIFINSKENEENSHEPIDPQNIFLRHPHKHHGIHNDFGAENEHPAFREKNKITNEEVKDSIRIPEALNRNINNRVDEKENNILTPYRDADNKNKREIDILDENYPGPSKERHRRMWGAYEYLQWLLNELQDPFASQPNIPGPVDENINKTVREVDKENPNDVVNQDKIIENPKVVLEEKIELEPVSPDVIKIILQDNNENRLKRSIDVDSDLNSLINKSEEEYDENDSFDDFFKSLLGRKNLFTILVSVYNADK